MTSIADSIALEKAFRMASSTGEEWSPNDLKDMISTLLEMRLAERMKAAILLEKAIDVVHYPTKDNLQELRTVGGKLYPDAQRYENEAKQKYGRLSQVEEFDLSEAMVERAVFVSINYQYDPEIAETYIDKEVCVDDVAANPKLAAMVVARQFTILNKKLRETELRANELEGWITYINGWHVIPKDAKAPKYRRHDFVENFTADYTARGEVLASFYSLKNKAYYIVQLMGGLFAISDEDGLRPCMTESEREDVLLKTRGMTPTQRIDELLEYNGRVVTLLRDEKATTAALKTELRNIKAEKGSEE